MYLPRAIREIQSLYYFHYCCLFKEGDFYEKMHADFLNFLRRREGLNSKRMHEMHSCASVHNAFFLRCYKCNSSGDFRLACMTHPDILVGSLGKQSATKVHGQSGPDPCLSTPNARLKLRGVLYMFDFSQLLLLWNEVLTNPTAATEA
jgi:hypothetical protein